MVRIPDIRLTEACAKTSINRRQTCDSPPGFCGFYIAWEDWNVNGRPAYASKCTSASSPYPYSPDRVVFLVEPFHLPPVI